MALTYILSNDQLAFDVDGSFNSVTYNGQQYNLIEQPMDGSTYLEGTELEIVGMISEVNGVSFRMYAADENEADQITAVVSETDSEDIDSAYYVYNDQVYSRNNEGRYWIAPLDGLYQFLSRAEMEHFIDNDLKHLN